MREVFTGLPPKFALLWLSAKSGAHYFLVHPHLLLQRSRMKEPGIGIIGGSGLYQIEGFEDAHEIRLDTPFGPPSDAVIAGNMQGRPVFFLPRHGRGHRLLPSELNHRANIWALRSLGVRWIISVTAVGSLQDRYHPRDAVIPDQLVDQTSRRTTQTFFGQGIVGHVSFAEPYSPNLRRILLETCRETGLTAHDGGTYVTMDGPAFSTRAESLMNRSLGWDVIGMTNAAEAKLAREAEIAFATLAMVTDYDCWKQEEEEVHVDMVIEHLHANAGKAKAVVAGAVRKIPQTPCWKEHQALDRALITHREFWPRETCQKLFPLLERFLIPAEGSLENPER